MYSNILVPVEFTDRDEPSVKQALRIVKKRGGTITLLHVIEKLDLPDDEMEEFYKRLATRARRRMRRLVENVKTSADVRFETRYGRRARAIVDHVGDNNIDLVIMASHRIEPGDPPSAWMTISHQVAIFAGCSVMLLR